MEDCVHTYGFHCTFKTIPTVTDLTYPSVSYSILQTRCLDFLTFYLIVQGFHRTYATGAACQQRTLTPPDTWSCPTLGLACVLMSRPISPELVLSPDFRISNTPRYFSFALCKGIIFAYKKNWLQSHDHILNDIIIISTLSRLTFSLNLSAFPVMLLCSTNCDRDA